MGECTCKELCWTGDYFLGDKGLVYPNLRDPETRQLITYDLDPRAPYSPHFKFTDPDDQRISNALRLLQEKANIERQLNLNEGITEFKNESEKLRNRLVAVDAALRDIPNKFKEEAMKPPRQRERIEDLQAQVARLQEENLRLKERQAKA